MKDLITENPKEGLLENENYEVPNKKMKSGFSIKEFRKHLKSEQKLTALSDFLLSINNSKDVIQSYLKHGGSTAEIINTLEGDSIPPILVFEIYNHILLEIATKFEQNGKEANDTCRFFLQKFNTLINKMLGLSSSTKERVITLKLLTTIVTHSGGLAKEILLNLNLSLTNLELITKTGNETRQAFIHFLMAFLLSGLFSSLSVLLEKRGLITSIIAGLRYDKADDVILVMDSMKQYILENVSVTKTTKMKIFNTLVVKDIINLYNWKGGSNENSTYAPSELDKSKVNESVHSFLLTLCTSHKFGVVFKDPNIGFHKNQNTLIDTVLERLTAPWLHSYAKELVLEIMKVAPDLTTTVWKDLGNFIKPRDSDKWLKAMEFAHSLLDCLQPNIIDNANLSSKQINSLLITLIAPVYIVKILKEEDSMNASTGHQVTKLLLKMCCTFEKFHTNFGHLNLDFSNYISQHFWRIDELINNVENRSDENLNLSLDLISKYKILAPNLFEDLSIEFDIKSFLLKCGPNAQLKATHLFIDIEPVIFQPQTEIFRSVLSHALETYFSTKDMVTLTVLNELLRNSNIFDNCLMEINFWINGILNHRKFDQNICDFLCEFICYVSRKDAHSDSLLNELPVFLENFPIGKSVRNYLNFVVLACFHVCTNFVEKFQIISQLNDRISNDILNYISSWCQSQLAVLCCSKGKLLDGLRAFSDSFLTANLEPFEILYPDQALNFLQIVIFYITNLTKMGLLKENHQKNSRKFLNSLSFDNDAFINTILTNSILLKSFTPLIDHNFPTKFLIEFITNNRKIIPDKALVEIRNEAYSYMGRVLKKPEKYGSASFSLSIIEIIGLDDEQCTKLLRKFVDNFENKQFFVIPSYCLMQLSKTSPIDETIFERLTQIFIALIVDNVPSINVLSMAFHTYLNSFPHHLKTLDCQLFESLIMHSEFNRDHLSFCEFLLRKSLFWDGFHRNLDEICSRKSHILFLLNVVVENPKNNDLILGKIFTNIEPSVVKALQKPHKASQHFHNSYQSLGILIEKFMNVENFLNKAQKFETTELFHVFLLEKVFTKMESPSNLKNILLTFIHLLSQHLKQKTIETEIFEIFYKFLKNLPKDLNLEANESFRNFSKLCLKAGVGDYGILLKILNEMIDLTVSDEADAQMILEMLFSHSRFLEIVLGVQQKEGIFEIWLNICMKWTNCMDRNHVPIILSAYSGTNADSTILKLLQLYEKHQDQTKFFDFKPFLWDKGAASHYSIRTDGGQYSLLRQPKITDVLNNLNYNTITATINNPTDLRSYDLDFFLPLFSHILAPENPVLTYKFTQTGALALTLLGLKTSQKLATCHILQRFYFHLESRQFGKDNLLWLRFIQAICKGISIIDEFHVNSFVAIFLAKMALILNQPNDTMYLPLTKYLSAKDTLDFSTIPEIYTFLHSPAVDSTKHKHFILELVRDGILTHNDFKIFLKTMAFKLISELCSSTICDNRSRILILEIFERSCESQESTRILCTSFSFIPQINSLILTNFHDESVLMKLLQILLKILDYDSDRHRVFLIYSNLIQLYEDCVNLRNQRILQIYYKVLSKIVGIFPDFFTNEHLELFLAKSNDPFCEYLVKYGCEFVSECDDYFRGIFLNKLKASNKEL